MVPTKNLQLLIDGTRDRLSKNFGFAIDIEGFEEFTEELDTVLDVDYDSLRQLNKETLLWHEYLSDLQASLKFYMEQFSNTLEVYSYLQHLSKKNKSEFLRMAPKYKISTRVEEDAVMELSTRKSEMEVFVKNLKSISRFIESYKRYVIFHYYRTSRLIRGSYIRFKNAGE